jgi:hypothetical protein
MNFKSSTNLEILNTLDEPFEHLLHRQFGHVAKEKLESLLELIKEIQQRPSWILKVPQGCLVFSLTSFSSITFSS